MARCAASSSETCLIRAPAVLLVGGGSAGLYAVTTNPPCLGRVIGMAARAGAVDADAEITEVPPTALLTGRDPAALTTDAIGIRSTRRLETT